MQDPTPQPLQMIRVTENEVARMTADGHLTVDWPKLHESAANWQPGDKGNNLAKMLVMMIEASPELAAAKAELARWRDASQHWIVRDGDQARFVLGNAFTTDTPYPGTQSEPLIEHIHNLQREIKELTGDLAAARAERDRLQRVLDENNAVLSRRIGA